MLQRTPDETPARWSRVHQPGPGRTASDRRARCLPGPDRGRRQAVRFDLGVARRATEVSPTERETRLLSAAADQIGQALALDRLAAESQAAEIARQSDALKSALLQSVSHDLRTPLATIRAAAGTLRPGSGLSAHDQQESADAIDREVEYLESPRDQPARPEPDRGRRAARGTRRLRARRPRRPDGRTAATRAWATGRSRSDLDARPVEVDPVFLDEAADERDRERDQVHAARGGDPHRGRAAGGRAVRPPHDRGRGPGRPRSGPAADLRQVLSGPGRRRRIAVRDGHRPGRRSRADRGDGRSGRRSSQRARRTRDRHRPAGGRSPWRRPPRRSGDGRRRPRTTGPTILVVEDDEETRQALVRELTARGYRTDVAPDGRTALLRWESRRPDVVLLDLGSARHRRARRRSAHPAPRRRRRS